MTKREQAAQLLDELKEMAAGDAVAMAVVQDMTTKLEDSGIAEKSGNNLVVKSHMIFYGTEADEKYCENIVCELENMWNEPKVCVEYDGVGYNVVFVFTYEVSTVKDVVVKAKVNKSPLNNFIRLETTNKKGRSYMLLNDNSGFWVTSDDLGNSTTGPHEKGHGYGLEHSDGDQRGKGQPNIMSARGTYVDPEYQYDPKAKAGEKGGTINPRKRKVSEAEVRAVVSGLTFNNKGIANIGNANNTLFSKWN